MKKDFDSMPASNRHRRTITLSTIYSSLAICGIVLPLIGVLATPLIVNYLSTAMADEIRNHVQQQVTPVNAGMKVLIENSIAELEDEIAQLEYRSRTTPATFTQMDQSVLTTKKRRLEAQREALAAMKEAEKNRQK